MTDTPLGETFATHNTPVPLDRLAPLQRRMIMALDGLWYMNVLAAIGFEKTHEIDVRIFISHFRMATRMWRELNGLDGKSTADKAGVFQGLAQLYGHEFDLRVSPERVTMRITKCAFYENLKRAGRADVAIHDCRALCQRLAPPWFAEVEPRTNGAGTVDLRLPVGGTSCDWTVEQPV